MAPFVFRKELEQSSLKGRLRKMIKIHRVVNIERLAREAGLPANTVRSLLEAMIICREVERLRPVGYYKDDMDFFLLCHLPRTASNVTQKWQWPYGRLHNWNCWIDRAKHAVRAPVLGRRQNACF